MTFTITRVRVFHWPDDNAIVWVTLSLHDGSELVVHADTMRVIQVSVQSNQAGWLDWYSKNQPLSIATFDKPAPNEEVATHLRRFHLRISEGDAPAVREVLRKQIVRESHAQGDGNTLLMRLCCVQLFFLAAPEDTVLIWQTIQTNRKTLDSIEVQLLCGIGLEETLRFLETSPLPGAKGAFTYLFFCRENGDFAGFSPEDQWQTEQRYYESYLSGDTEK